MSRVTHLSLSRSLVITFVLVLYQDTGCEGLGDTITSCGFEDVNLCGYDQFNWTRQSGATPTVDTGPSAAYEGSYYLYIDAENTNEGDKAVLQIPRVFWAGTACVSLAYHMYGEDIGTLTLTLSALEDLNLLRTTGNQGNTWIRYQYRINFPGFNTAFVMEGIRGSGEKGDIAIDDFSVVTGLCTTSVSLPYSCSFESDLCDTWNYGSFDIRWSRTRKDNPAPETGSSGDSGGDWIISLASDGGNREVSGSDGQDSYDANINTPQLDFTGDICVKFKYYLSSNLSSVSVHRLDMRRWVHGVSAANDAIWRSVSLTVRSFVGNHSISFQGIFPRGQAASMALDDISISTDSCDDCAVNNGGCSQTCRNTDTGPMCSCRSGYRQVGETGCQDCADNNGGCNQTCRNTDTGPMCSCHMGYVKFEETGCQDIDECSDGTDACSHECQNEDGTYSCHCPGGWSLTGDGYNCQDIDECAADTDNECDHECTNVEGNYNCSCRVNYILATDGRHCIECETAYERRVAASQLLTSDCSTTFSHPEINLDDCFLEACSTQTGVVAYFNMVCDLKRCDGSNLRLNTVSGSSGWDIYVLNTRWLEFIMNGNLDEPRGGDAFPLVAVVAGVVVPVILIVIIVIAVVFIMRRRGSRKVDQSVQCVHYAGQPASVGEVRTPPLNEDKPDVGIYDEVTETPERQASVTNTQVTYRNAAFQGAYQYLDLDLGLDIDECAADTDNECDHECTNVEGNYNCSCRVNYILATDGRHCFECESAYERRVAASQLLTSDCPTTSSHPEKTLDDCFLEACSTQTGVVAYFNMVCDLKRCDGSNLRLNNVSGSSGWDIYVLNTTWLEFIMNGNLDEPRGGDAFPLVAVVAGVVVPVILIVIIVIAVVFIMRRRGSRKVDQSVQCVHNAGQPASVGEVRTPPLNEDQPDVGIYDEVTETPERQASVTNTLQGAHQCLDLNLGLGEYLTPTPKQHDDVQ